MAYEVTECLKMIKEMFFPTEPIYKELTFTREAYAKLIEAERHMYEKGRE